LLEDSGDAIAPQVAAGMIEKVGMTAMPEAMMAQGTKYVDLLSGGLTPAQHKQIDQNMERVRGLLAQSGAGISSGVLPVKTRTVVGENKQNPMVSFYAAAIGVMFLMFTSSGAAGAILDEAESGTLDRVLSSRITMTMLLAGKLTYNMLLAFTQLVMMFLWAWAVFQVDFFSHIPGFIVMGICTAFAVSAFGILLASFCKTRSQLGSLSTLVILIMSSIGGSMFPRVLMPESMQKAGLFTINAWAIDGFTKVFWRDEPISALWPQVLVLLATGTALFAIARWLARRWEFS
jgi:ABC-2 type transport system permease protein